MAISASDLNGHAVQPEGHRGAAFLMLDGLRRPQPDNPHEVALCVLGLGGDGTPVPLALRVAAREDEHAWRSLLAHLRARGIGREALLVVCDDHPALQKAVQAVYPELPMQVSVAHRLLALARKVDASSRAACLAEARAIFASPDLNTAVARFRAWRATWIKLGGRAVASLESDLASCLTFYRFPAHLWAKIRTVNVVERAFRDARRTAPSVSAKAVDDAVNDEPTQSNEIPTPAPEVLHQVVFGTLPETVDATGPDMVGPDMVGPDMVGAVTANAEIEEDDATMNAEMPEPSEGPTERRVDMVVDPHYDGYTVLAALAGGSPVGDKDVPAFSVVASEAATIAEHQELAVSTHRAPADAATAHTAGHVMDLSQDADFMWWLKERRNRSHSRTVRLTVAAATALSGFVTGIVLTRLI